MILFGLNFPDVSGQSNRLGEGAKFQDNIALLANVSAILFFFN